VGNLLVLVTMLHARRAGHRVVVLIGGATARIGDPSGKSEERPLLDEAVVAANAQGIRRDVTAVFDNYDCLYEEDGGSSLPPIEFVDNSSW